MNQRLDQVGCLGAHEVRTELLLGQSDAGDLRRGEDRLGDEAVLGSRPVATSRTSPTAYDPSTKSRRTSLLSPLTLVSAVFRRTSHCSWAIAGEAL